MCWYLYVASLERDGYGKALDTTSINFIFSGMKDQALTSYVVVDRQDEHYMNGT